MAPIRPEEITPSYKAAVIVAQLGPARSPTGVCAIAQ